MDKETLKNIMDDIPTLGTPKKENARGADRGKRATKRVPVSGNRDILTVLGKEDGYMYRWILDIGNRIQKFEKAGYEIVTHDVQVGDARVGTPEGLGSAVEAAAGGGNQRLVLMRIPEEYYREDQEAKEANIRALEASMGKDVEGTYGSIGIERK
jgi:hypothetical protein